MVMIMGNEQGNCINNGEANRGNVPTLDALLYRVYHTDFDFVNCRLFDKVYIVENTLYSMQCILQVTCYLLLCLALFKAILLILERSL